MRATRPSSALAAAFTLALVLATSAGARTLAQAARAAVPAGSLKLATSLAPNPTFFGDPITAVVTVSYDTRVVDAGSLALNPSFSPYAVTGLPQVSSTQVGPERTTVYRYTILCVTDGCLPGATPLSVHFPPFVATARATAALGGGVVRTRALWQPAIVNSRLQRFDRTHSVPRFRWPATMPPVHYDVSPGLLASLLTVAGGILGVAGLGLLGSEALRLRARLRRGPRPLSPLEAALAFTREAAARSDPTDRRKAIGLLATTLAEEGHESLADSTHAVAWSEAPPSTEQARAVADEVEAAVGAPSA